MGSEAVTNSSTAHPNKPDRFPGMADPTIPLSDNTLPPPSNWISILGIPDRPTANMAPPRGVRSAGMA